MLAALGYFALGGWTTYRKGDMWCLEVETNIFFVTLEKDAGLCPDFC